MPGIRSATLASALVIAGLAAAAAHFVLVRTAGAGTPAHDIYAYFYPNLLYALDSLRDGGRGLLWNPYQNCGQPFFANACTGLLYPPHVLFLLLGPDAGLRAVLALNMLIGGAGAYLLCREMGLGTVAAAAGALAFQLGNASAQMTSWSPMHSGPYAWFPLALLCCERLLRAPSLSGCLALGGVFTLALLPGYPPIVLLVYQVVALRVVWELICRRAPRPVASVAAVAIGFVLPFLFGAVQLIPMLEYTRESTRLGTLAAADMGAVLTWAALRRALAFRSIVGNPHVLVPTLIAMAALLRAATRRYALFYLLVLVLYLALSSGPRTPVFDLYAHLPLAGMFRYPARFTWVTSLCAAMLTGLGLDALTRPADAGSPRLRLLGLLLPVLALLALHFLVVPGGLSPREIRAALVALAGVALACFAPRARPAAGLLVLGAIAYNLILAPNTILQRLLPSGAPLASRRADLETLRGLMTPQSRAYFVTRHPRDALFGFMQKTASLVRIPVIWDYEAEVSRRYAEFFTMMRTGRPMAGLSDILFAGASLTPPGLNRRLFELTAARYLVAAAAVDQVSDRLGSGVARIQEIGDLRLYLNPSALPRAFVVPGVVVVPDRAELLARLATGGEDLRRVAFVETPPPSGFTGAPLAPADGTVRFVTDDPENLVLEVTAAQGGFLVLSDQHYPGWHATVNGRPAPIQRANYAFRAVEIPGGTSTVEFRYAPGSLRLGAGLSGLSLGAAAVILLWPRRRRLGCEGAPGTMPPGGL